MHASTTPQLKPRIGLDDTPPEIRKVMVEGYRRMSPAEKAKRMVQLTRGVQQMALMGLRDRHPDASPRELRLRLAALWIDPETMRKAFGWDPGEAR